MKKYKIKYRVEPGEWTKEEIDNQFDGLCDRVIIFSIVVNDEGNSSTGIFSANADGSTFTGKEEFLQFIIWASILSEDESLAPEARAICLDALQRTREIIRRGNEESRNRETEGAL